MNNHLFIIIKFLLIEITILLEQDPTSCIVHQTCNSLNQLAIELQHTSQIEQHADPSSIDPPDEDSIIHDRPKGT